MQAESDDFKAFATDPVAYFDWSFTRMLSLPREEIDRLQLAALRYRFDCMRNRIGYLKKLADALAIDRIVAIDDVVPLLFDHTIYKSYPSSLLIKNRFDLVTAWLAKLTSRDLSGLDVRDCSSIDEWIDRLDSETDIRIHHSSGTTGTISFIPKSKSELMAYGKQLPLRFQDFGDPRPAVPMPKVDVILPAYRTGTSGSGRFNDCIAQYVAHGDEQYIHCGHPGRVSADITFLAARVRAAKAKGEFSNLEAPASLIARLNEFEVDERKRSERMRDFLARITQELVGRRVWLTGPATHLYPLATSALARGQSRIFAANSVVASGGGAKGVKLSEDWRDRLAEFAGVKRVMMNYAMTEISGFNRLCSHGYYHIVPWLIPFVLDPRSGESFPRSGTVTGRMAFFDLLPDSRWGGFVSGDEVTIHWDPPCACGQSSPYLDYNITRFSEKQGGDDKISCAAAAEAQEEAMDFLSRYVV
jgi:hypothetical protein